jgi:hypothetical protein
MTLQDNRFYNTEANILEHDSFNSKHHILPPGSISGDEQKKRFDWTSLLDYIPVIMDNYFPGNGTQGGSTGLGDDFNPNGGYTPPNDDPKTVSKLQGSIMGMPATTFYAVAAAIMFLVLVFVIRKSK